MRLYTDIGLLDLHAAVELPITGDDLLCRILCHSSAGTSRELRDPAPPAQRDRDPEDGVDAPHTRGTRDEAEEEGDLEVVGVTGLEPVTPSLSSWWSQVSPRPLVINCMQGHAQSALRVDLRGGGGMAPALLTATREHRAHSALHASNAHEPCPVAAAVLAG